MLARFAGGVRSYVDRQLASGVAVAALVLLVAGVAAVLAADTAPAAAPAPRPAVHHETQHASSADSARIQHGVQSAYCPPPGSEIQPGEPTATLTVTADGRTYGDGPLTITAGALVRVLLVNDDVEAHELGVYHPSRPGCPLVLVEAGAGEVAEVDLRLGAGTYVYGDRTHEGEHDLLTVEKP